MRRDHRAFRPAFKQQAMELLWRNGKNANQIAKELGINQTTLSWWQREASAAPTNINGFQAAEELKLLRREVAHLRMERDILKKRRQPSSPRGAGCGLFLLLLRKFGRASAGLGIDVNARAIAYNNRRLWARVRRACGH